jgi:HTH-type transcriptional regulator/antitoxin HipB
MTDYVIRHPQQLASLLKALRTQAGLSQTQVAARLGVSHQAVSALERQPEKATVERLMRVLGVLQVDLALRSTGTPSATTEW